jgi:hypothetical protein
MESQACFFKLSTFVLFPLAFITCASRSAEQTTFLIPKNFQGNVLIIFNQKDGGPAEYEGESRIYRIPESGVLRTQFEPSYGISKMDEFYLVDSLGDRKKLEYLYGGPKISTRKSTAAICYGLETGKDNNGTRHFLVFSVAEPHNADSISEQRSRNLWKVLDGK